MMRKTESRIRLLAVMACALLMGSCLFSGNEPAATSTEIPNELQGILVLKNGDPARGATVSIYPVGFLPGPSGVPKGSAGARTHAVVTDAAGRYSFKGLAQGDYNILGSLGGLASLRDSITFTSGAQDAGKDTLKASGGIAGRVRLQPNHSARTAWVQALGTSVFANVGEDGLFALNGLAEGPYQLRVSTTIAEYSPLFAPASVRAGSTDTLPDYLVPYYNGIPVVTGLKAARSDSGKSVRLDWDVSAYPHLEAYLVYRDTGTAPLPMEVLVGQTTAATFTDTVFSASPRPGQIHLNDIQPHTLGYRIKILTKGNDKGPTYGTTSITVKSPTAITGKEAVWTQAVAHGKYFSGSIAAAAVWKDSLWAVELSDSGYAIWSSAEGAVWTKSKPAHGLSEPFGETDGNRNRIQIRILNGKAWMLMSQLGMGGGWKNLLWNSTDMRTWSPVEMEPGFPVRGYAGFFSHAGFLWVCNGGNTVGPMGLGNLTDIWRSPDGKAWEKISGFSFNGYGFLGGAALHDDRMWLAGGGQPFFPDADFINLGVWSSSDGKDWTRASHLPIILPRTRFGMESFAGELWVMGGTRYQNQAPPGGLESWTDAGLAADVWSSPDGVQWTLRNAESPFGPRGIDVTAVWKNRLWVFGGTDRLGSDLTDVWYAEAP